MKIASVELGNSIAEIEEAVSHLTIPRGEPAFKVGALLLAAMLIGTDSSALEAFTGYEPEFIQIVSARLKGGQIWGAGKPCYEWWFGHDDELFTIAAFCADALVGSGQLVRSWSTEEGEFQYGPPTTDLDGLC